MNSHSPDFIADMLIHLGRAASARPDGYSLSPAQWSALRFFAHSNRLSRTPSAFASFQNTTRGTASQTVKSLVTAGYLERCQAQKDRRSVEFALTNAGRALLTDDPAVSLSRSIDGLSGTEREDFCRTLLALSHNLDQVRQAPVFGSCETCGFFQPDANSPGSGHCAATGTQLTADDTGRLCCQFTPA
ncbi:MAG: winged helix-turn-helix transcriptional regulator [Oleiphilaceae bacterium]|nr:winged helix-turn-helix transcriptional regulator [Oleiphilaceae bacterium]